MTGKAEVERQKQRLDATFKRASLIGAEAELLSDFAQYLCVLVSGFLEQAVIELVLEHVRKQSAGSVQRHVEPRLRRFTNANSHRIVELMGSFDPDWRKDLEEFLVDEYKDAVNSVVNLRHGISHGRSAGVTMTRVQEYYLRVKQVVDHVANLCAPNT
jgi:RiboL-PSP-HEPN